MVPVIRTFRTAIVQAVKGMAAPVVADGTHDDIITASILLQTSMAKVCART
jgi:hypothetical protein